MPAKQTAAPLVPGSGGLRSLREAAATCKACPLWKGTTQTVFGEGLKRSELMLIGEQPGDREDIDGHPFVGPAGHLLDRALEEAGIRRDKAYLTNVVKHFKFQYKGKRRIHKKPNMSEIAACRPWLDAEIENVRPRAIVVLGATAAQALLGRDFKVTKERCRLIDSDLAPIVTATVHPSSILRAPDDDARHQAMKEFVRDLELVARELG